MKFEDLHEHRCTIQGLAAHAEMLQGRAADPELLHILSLRKAESPQVAESIRRMSRPGAAIVMTQLFPGLFGGPLCQVLKCLTAVGLCERLEECSISVVPVAAVNPDARAWSSDHSINLVDADGEIHKLELPSSGNAPAAIAGLISRVADLGRGMFDSEVLELLRSSFLPGKSDSSATERLFSALMRDLGLVVIDLADFKKRSRRTESLPVLAYVIDPLDGDSSLQNEPGGEKAGFPLPIAWPSVRATVGDTGSRRTLHKYHLDLSQLYRGESDVLDTVKRELPRSSLEKLKNLELEVGASITDLQSRFPEGMELSLEADPCREKVLYQIRKLRDLFDAALKSREKTANLKIRKACNLLAPNRRLQERELAGIQVPLAYSIDGLRVLSGKLNVLSFEHQLIWME